MNELAVELFKGLDFNRDDFTLEWHEYDFHSIPDRHKFLFQLMEAKRAALKNGYTIEECSNHNRMVQSIRFFRSAPERVNEGEGKERG